jgi:antirestriction protein ArdC
MSKVDIYQVVTDRVLAGLEAAQARAAAGHRYSLPWVTVGALHEPRSLQGRAYRGINYVLLSMLGSVFPSQTFGTYKGWQAKGCQVRKGEKGIPVIFWKMLPVQDKATGQDKVIPFARGYTVFAGEQVDGFDCAAHLAASQLQFPNRAVSIAAADAAVKAFCGREGLGLEGHPSRAFYAPSRDVVCMPPMAAFQDTESYYAVLLHELGHATGHEKRLKRDFSGRFGSSAYAFEELVAEFAAAMMCARLHISNEPRADHADYIANWLQVLRDNPRAAVTAAAAAQKAADYVLGEAAAVQDETELAEAA